MKKLICFSIILTASSVNAIEITPNPSSKTTDYVSQANYDYFEFNKKANHKYTACLKPTSGDADLYGHHLPNPSSGFYQFRSWKSGTSYDCIDFTAGQDGRYYLAVHGYAASNYEIYVIDADLNAIPSQLIGKLTCPLNTTNPNPCGELTSSRYGPFGSTWGNSLSKNDPFFSGSNDKFHSAVDWKVNPGSSVYAVYKGVVKEVISAGSIWGHTVIIEHTVDNFTFTAVYMHLEEDYSQLPNKHDNVSAGQKIGEIYNMNVAGEVPHLHFSLHKGSYREDHETYQKSIRGSLPYNTFPEDRFNPDNNALYK